MQTELSRTTIQKVQYKLCIRFVSAKQLCEQAQQGLITIEGENEKQDVASTIIDQAIKIFYELSLEEQENMKQTELSCSSHHRFQDEGKKPKRRISTEIMSFTPRHNRKTTCSTSISPNKVSSLLVKAHPTDSLIDSPTNKGRCWSPPKAAGSISVNGVDPVTLVALDDSLSIDKNNKSQVKRSYSIGGGEIAAHNQQQQARSAVPATLKQHTSSNNNHNQSHDNNNCKKAETAPASEKSRSLPKRCNSADGVCHKLLPIDDSRSPASEKSRSLPKRSNSADGVGHTLLPIDDSRSPASEKSRSLPKRCNSADGVGQKLLPIDYSRSFNRKQSQMKRSLSADGVELVGQKEQQDPSVFPTSSKQNASNNDTNNKQNTIKNNRNRVEAAPASEEFCCSDNDEDNEYANEPAWRRKARLAAEKREEAWYEERGLVSPKKAAKQKAKVTVEKPKVKRIILPPPPPPFLVVGVDIPDTTSNTNTASTKDQHVHHIASVPAESAPAAAATTTTSLNDSTTSNSTHIKSNKENEKQNNNKRNNDDEAVVQDKPVPVSYSGNNIDDGEEVEDNEIDDDPNEPAWRRKARLAAEKREAAWYEERGLESPTRKQKNVAFTNTQKPKAEDPTPPVVEDAIGIATTLPDTTASDTSILSPDKKSSSIAGRFLTTLSVPFSPKKRGKASAVESQQLQEQQQKEISSEASRREHEHQTALLFEAVAEPSSSTTIPLESLTISPPVPTKKSSSLAKKLTNMTASFSPRKKKAPVVVLPRGLDFAVEQENSKQRLDLSIDPSSQQHVPIMESAVVQQQELHEQSSSSTIPLESLTASPKATINPTKKPSSSLLSKQLTNITAHFSPRKKKAPLVVLPQELDIISTEQQKNFKQTQEQRYPKQSHSKGHPKQMIKECINLQENIINQQQETKPVVMLSKTMKHKSEQALKTTNIAGNNNSKNNNSNKGGKKWRSAIKSIMKINQNSKPQEV